MPGLHFTFEQYSGCTHLFNQMSTFSNLTYKRDLLGQLWSLLAYGKSPNRQGTSATLISPFKYLNGYWPYLLCREISVATVKFSGFPCLENGFFRFPSDFPFPVFRRLCWPFSVFRHFFRTFPHFRHISYTPSLKEDWGKTQLIVNLSAYVSTNKWYYYHNSVWFIIEREAGR